MAWIESHQDIRDHPKTVRLRRRLGVSLPATIGHLHMFWWWALSYAEDGDLTRFEDEIIADACGWEGDAAEFIECLIASGFIDEDRTIHDWDRYTGRIRKQRHDNRLRQQRWRAANAVRSPSTRDVTEDNALVTRDSPLDNPATGPDRTKPNRTGPGIAPPVVPPTALDTEVGADAPSAAASAPSQAELMRRLSEDARAVLDFHREQHGRARPAKLTPAAVEALEEAVADLGVERCKEGVRYMARKIPPVPDLSKALSAARTKRQNEVAGVAPTTQHSGRPPPASWGRGSRTNGVPGARYGSVAQTAEEEAALEAWANGH